MPAHSCKFCDDSNICRHLTAVFPDNPCVGLPNCVYARYLPTSHEIYEALRRRVAELQQRGEKERARELFLAVDKMEQFL